MGQYAPGQTSGGAEAPATPPGRVTEPVDLADATQTHSPPAEGAGPGRVGWSGVLGVEGELTGDGRLIEPGALRWEDLPVKIRYVAADVGMHDGAVVVGTIETIERREGGIIWGSGFFDGGSVSGMEAIRQVREGLTDGVSMDLDDVSFEVRVAAELMEDEQGGMPLFLKSVTTKLAAPAPTSEPVEEEPPTEPAEGEPDLPLPDADGRITVVEMNSDDEIRVTTDGRIRAATLVAIPAFSRAKITLSDADVADAPPGVPAAPALAAAAGSVTRLDQKRPPRDWFAAPRLDGPTPLTVTEDGRVYGHLAEWNSCHLSHTDHGRCVRPPRSATSYAYFHTGALVAADGSEVAVGHITLDTMHADPTVNPAATLAHYENTGTCVADVRAGEDAHGIWVAGAIRPRVSGDQVRALRSAPLSGDWRRVGTNLELVAALAVNVPGFAIPRPSGLVASGAKQSLLAVGMLAPRRVIAPSDPASFLSTEDLRYLKRLAAREASADATAAATRVHAFALRRRAHATTNHRKAAV